MKEEKKQWSRRQFINSAVAGMAGIAAIHSLPGCTSKPDDGIIRLGFIGMGRQSMFLLNGFMRIPGVEVVAGCDVYGIKRKRFEKRVTDFYKKAGKETKVQTYEKYNDLLKRKDINLVK